tara:strand:- start:735 stop:911 length:177 start_codon:yes stop_codon:yes gene_type:complete
MCKIRIYIVNIIVILLFINKGIAHQYDQTNLKKQELIIQEITTCYEDGKNNEKPMCKG